jgi:hypothetical protein
VSPLKCIFTRKKAFHIAASRAIREGERFVCSLVVPGKMCLIGKFTASSRFFPFIIYLPFSTSHLGLSRAQVTLPSFTLQPHHLSPTTLKGRVKGQVALPSYIPHIPHNLTFSALPPSKGLCFTHLPRIALNFVYRSPVCSSGPEFLFVTIYYNYCT